MRLLFLLFCAVLVGAVMADPMAGHAQKAFAALKGANTVLSATNADLKAGSAFFPGVSSGEMTEFLQLADANGDGVVAEYEFVRSIAESVRAATAANPQEAVLLQMAQEEQAPTPVAKPAAAASPQVQPPRKINTADDGCVICQYIIERAETNVKQSGVIPATAGAANPQEQVLLQTQQTPFDVAAAKVIGATRQSTKYQRELERQKYNEIYRIMDVTLDDVCEQAMPGPFYPYCKAVYKAQADIVDGLRYQYRPSDICYKIGMCSKTSYITKGLHSRYKVMKTPGDSVNNAAPPANKGATPPVKK